MYTASNHLQQCHWRGADRRVLRSECASSGGHKAEKSTLNDVLQRLISDTFVNRDPVVIGYCRPWLLRLVRRVNLSRNRTKIYLYTWAIMNIQYTYTMSPEACHSTFVNHNFDYWIFIHQLLCDFQNYFMLNSELKLQQTIHHISRHSFKRHYTTLLRSNFVVFRFFHCWCSWAYLIYKLEWPEHRIPQTEWRCRPAIPKGRHSEK